MGKPMDRSKLAFIPPRLAPFEEVYPQLESAVVEFVEYNLGLRSYSGKWPLQWKGDQLHTFAVLPKRWVVERSLAWLEKCRRL